jgi:hypothetical protein
MGNEQDERRQTRRSRDTPSKKKPSNIFVMVHMASLPSGIDDTKNMWPT